MRLREDTATSSALRLALEDDPRELPSSEAVKRLAEVIELRLHAWEPTRLSVCVDTPNALKAALFVDNPPDPRVLSDLWERIRRDAMAEPTVKASAVEQRRHRLVVPLSSRRGRNMALITLGAVLVSTLAAAGLKLLFAGPFSSNTIRNTQSSTPQSSERPTPRSTNALVQESRLPNSPTSIESATASTVTLHVPAEPIPKTPTAPLRRIPATPTNATTDTPTEKTNSIEQKDSSSVIAELQLLRQAWAELRAGRPQSALEIAKEHAARYPAGVLIQEREVVQIQALAQLGLTQEAQRKASRFEEKFPDSPHKPLTNTGVDRP